MHQKYRKCGIWLINDLKNLCHGDKAQQSAVKKIAEIFMSDRILHLDARDLLTAGLSRHYDCNKQAER